MAKLDRPLPRGGSCFRGVAVSTAVADVDTSPGTQALYVGTTGDITVDMTDGATGVLFKTVPVGILPIGVTKVYKTGTTATNIVALY